MGTFGKLECVIKVPTFHEPHRTLRNHDKNTSFTPAGIELVPSFCGIPRDGKINARDAVRSALSLSLLSLSLCPLSLPFSPFLSQTVPVEIRFTPVACLHRRKLIPTNYGPNFTASVFCDTRTRVHLRKVANERAFFACHDDDDDDDPPHGSRE